MVEELVTLPPPENKGFTLVELSIVIVVIGLVIGAVTAGSSLVKTARMSAQITDLNKFESAYYAFKLQYNAIPGDMRNASSYWDGSTDGDGNGRITQDANWANTLSYENLKFFEHLSRAKLVPETYTNSFLLNIGYPALKINSGKGMIAGGLILGAPGVAYALQLSEAEMALRRVVALYWEVAKPTAPGGSEYNDNLGTSSPITLAAIDKKIDDGVARTGKFKGYMALSSIVGNCLTGISGNYLLTVTTDACNAEFIIAK